MSTRRSWSQDPLLILLAAGAGCFAWSAIQTARYLFSAPGGSSGTAAERLQRWKNLKIVAHRGANGDTSEFGKGAPENSLRAYRSALAGSGAAKGVDGIEIDVQLTLDNQLIVMHDDSVDRTTLDKGKVRQKTLSAMRSLDVSGALGAGDKAPLLEEVLELLRDYPDAELHLDIKPSVNDPKITLECVKMIVDRFLSVNPGTNIYPRTFLNVWNLDWLDAAGQLVPECRRVFLFPYAPEIGLLNYIHDVMLGSIAPRYLAKLRKFLFGFDVKEASLEAHPPPDGYIDRELYGYSIQSNLLGLTPNFARRVQAKGQRVQVWTCETEKGLLRAVDWLGVGCVLTDRPGLMKKLKDEMIERLSKAAV